MHEGPVSLGLRANWQQFTLLVIVNAFVGAMVGLERTVIPLIAEQDFGLVSRSATLSFLIGFGVVKALANLFAGAMQRGLAMGLNEFAGYLAVSFSAFFTGYLAGSYGLRPIPFYPGIAFALLGLILSVFFVTETRPFARQEAQERLGTLDERSSPGLEAGREPPFSPLLLLTSWKDRAPV